MRLANQRPVIDDVIIFTSSSTNQRPDPGHMTDIHCVQLIRDRDFVMCDVIDDTIYYSLSLANQRSVFGSRDHEQPIRGHYSGHVIKNSQSGAIIRGIASFGAVWLGLGYGLGLGLGLGFGLGVRVRVRG